MTSTTDAGEHPEVAEISDLTDGLLSPSHTAELRDHLAGCALCEDVYASLEEIRGLLGSLPGPTRMPADVAERIDAALAAEALLNSAAAEGKPGVSRETPPSAATVPRETSLDPVSVSRETSAAPLSVSRETSVQAPPRAAAAVPPPGKARGSSGPGRRAPGRRSSRSRRWPRILLGSAAAAAVLGVGGLLLQGVGTSGVEATKPDASASSGAGTPSGLSAATLGADVHRLLAEKKVHQAPEIGTRSSPETPLRGKPDAVPSCVRQGIGRAEQPLASTRSTYEGEDAFLVVLPHPADPKSVSAYIVAASCVSAAPPAPGKVLLTHSYRRD
ncbi:anti-sigma factor family protein [Streptomyces sp. NPDC056149]|uniref:anti-sigma factor family protein n=1 Tax=unclassified Streptomyces TaxID=2593676 RepID=UPI0023815DBB|nr:zf-HC2 domain-containing protein [Streptomyces sp. WZ-12]